MNKRRKRDTSHDTHRHNKRKTSVTNEAFFEYDNDDEYIESQFQDLAPGVILRTQRKSTANQDNMPETQDADEELENAENVTDAIGNGRVQSGQ